MIKSKGFTLVEIMIVVAIIAILAAIAIPQLIASRKMSRQNRCLSNVKLIAYAKDQMALANGWESGHFVNKNFNELTPWIKGDTAPICPSGGTYDLQPVSYPESCSYHGSPTSPTPLDTLTD